MSSSTSNFPQSIDAPPPTPTTSSISGLSASANLTDAIIEGLRCVLRQVPRNIAGCERVTLEVKRRSSPRPSVVSSPKPFGEASSGIRGGGDGTRRKNSRANTL